MRRPYRLAALSVLVVAVAMRTLPLWQSPLPFNPDGIIAVRLARSALRDGHLPLAEMATDDLLFPPLLATVGRVLGLDPMWLAQPLSAFVGALPGLLAVAVVRRLGFRPGWDWVRRGPAQHGDAGDAAGRGVGRGSTDRQPARDRAGRRTFAAATLAGVLVAVEGLYLHRSMPTDEQTVGLFLVPLAAVVVARAHGTGRRAWWLASAPLLVAVVPLHNLDGVVLALVLTVATALAVARGAVGGAAPLAALTGGFWLFLAGYHYLADRHLSVFVHQEARLTAVPGLVLAWVVLVAVGGAWLHGSRARVQRLLTGGAFVLLFALLAANAVVPLFPGTPATGPLLLAGLLPLALPVAFAVRAAPAALRTRPEGLALAALVGGPFVLVGVATTAAGTPEYLNLAYRTTTFLHVPVLVLAALGTVAVGARVGGKLADHGRPQSGAALRVGLAVVVVAAATASVPVALGDLSVLNYKGVTTPAELGAAEFASSHAGATWAGDDHLVRVEPPDGAAGVRAPTYAWLRGGADPPGCLVLAQRSWTTTGAQFFPAPPEPLAARAYREWLRTGDVVYRSGAGDPIAGVAPRGDGTC